MFDFYRSAHEVDSRRARALAAKVLDGELGVDSARVRAELRRRSVRFHLEVDVAGWMGVFAEPLARMYPDSRVVLLLRDCFSWLDSMVDHDLRRLRTWRPDAYYRAKYLQHNDVSAPEEAPLRDAGVIPVAALLRGWTAANRRVLAGVPADQLLVVRTEDLDRSVEALAWFTGVPESTIRPVHANRNPSPTRLLGSVPRSYVVEQAQEHCAPIMEQFWGAGWTDLATRLPQAPPS